MDIYGHLFESLAVNAADALDEGYRADGTSGPSIC
jgi:hypothetical protein